MTLHASLLNENDQTVAFVIAYTPLHNGAEILAQLTLERQSKIVRRLAEFQPDNLPGWSETMLVRLPKPLESLVNTRTCSVGEVCCPCPLTIRPIIGIDGIDLAGKILERLDRTVWQAILDDISRGDPKLVDNIRQRMFLFEDIVHMHDCDIESVLKNVEISQMAIALRDTSEELREKILKNMSKRTGKLLQEEIEYHGSRIQSDIEFAQREIVHIMRCLIYADKIRACA